MDAEQPPDATPRSVRALLDALPDARRDEAERLVAILREVTGEEPRRWPASIIGFGVLHYRYPSGREGDTARIGFAPRAANLVLHVSDGLDRYADLLDRLGPHRRGKGCLYLRRLRDADETVLRELIARSSADPG